MINGRQIILGIDPGSRKTGYGVIWKEKGREGWIAHGFIHASHDRLEDRLLQIFEGIKEVIQQHSPTQAAIEQVFVQKNIQSALKLGHARGAALTACATAGLNVHEYSPREIKKSTVGYGAADKTQMQHMIKMILQPKESLQADAADALAIALTHAHHCNTNNEWRKI